VYLSEKCCRIAPKKEGTDRQKDDFSYHLSDWFLSRLFWRFGAVHNIIVHRASTPAMLLLFAKDQGEARRIAANIAKLPGLLTNWQDV
jgi:hypothetical protein